MRDVLSEYNDDMISWDEAYCYAVNQWLSSPPEEQEFWSEQRDKLANIKALDILTAIGYSEGPDGNYIKLSQLNIR